MSNAQATNDQSQRPTNSRDGWLRQQKASTDSEPKSRGWFNKAGRVVGKGLYKGSALDVIIKDGRRMRPMYPEVWRSLFSKEGLKKARRRFFSNEITSEEGFPWSALTAMLLGAFIAVCIVAGVSSGYFPAQMPWINRVGLVALFLMGTVMSICYGLVLGILINRRYLRTANQSSKRRGEQ